MLHKSSKKKLAYDYTTCLWDSSIPLASRWAPHIWPNLQESTVDPTNPTDVQNSCSRAAWNCNNFFTLGRGKLWWKTPTISKRFTVCQGVSHCLNLTSHPHIPGRYPWMFHQQFMFRNFFLCGYLPRGPVGKIIDLRIGTSSCRTWFLNTQPLKLQDQWRSCCKQMQSSPAEITCWIAAMYAPEV